MTRSKREIAKEIESLRAEIRKHDELYYGHNRPAISDSEYDRLFKRLKELETQNPELLSVTSPTQAVSEKPSSRFNQAQHLFPMLSLDNSYSCDDIQSWFDRVVKNSGSQSHDLILNPKIDGLSLSLVYNEGNLVRAVTRGDGQWGDDVTANACTLKSIPRTISIKDGIFEVRGEVFMTRDNFQRLNERIISEGKTPFVNPRNAAAGSLRQKDAQITSQRPLTFLAYGYGDPGAQRVQSYSAFLELCNEAGLPVLTPYMKVSSIEEILNVLALWEQERYKWEFETDGVVIRLDDLRQQHKMGFTNRSPRWAIAYKFPAQKATTVVVDVVHSVGRTGVITPSAKLKPVLCGGVTISNATLHNYEEIKRLDIRIGDTVIIERAGEVIPKVVEVVIDKRLGSERIIDIPVVCPACGAPVIREMDQVALRCPNPNCPVQIERTILHFASREAMDIDGMGEVVVKQLLERHLLHDCADIYALELKHLLQLDLFAEKRAQNLLKAIKESKNKTLDRFIFGLGIRNIGEKAARTLAEHFGTLDQLMEASQQELEAVSDVGPVVAQSIIDFFAVARVKQTIEKLKKYGVNPRFDKKPSNSNSAFFEKTIVLTGELESMSRAQAEELIRSVGGNPSGSVSKKTHFVVIGANAGSKREKALKLNIPILDERSFLSMLKKVV